MVDARQRAQARGAALERLPQARVAQKDTRLLADGRERRQLERLEAAAAVPPHQEEGARDLPVEDERDQKRRLVGNVSERRARESGVPGYVIGPDNLPPAEHLLQSGEVGRGERARGERLDGVLRHPVRDDGTQQTGARVEEVGRDGVGSCEPGQLVADEPESLGQVGSRADDARDTEKAGHLAQPGIERLPRPGWCRHLQRSRRAWGCRVRGTRLFFAHRGYRSVYRDGTRQNDREIPRQTGLTPRAAK